MSVITVLDQAQGGRLFAAVANSLDLDEAQTRKAMGRLCPAIAAKLHDRAAADAELFQSLLALIEGGGGTSPLQDAEALTSQEAVADGFAILDDVFGSRSAALAALRKADESLPERELSRLAPISATAVVAALAEANRPLALAAAAAPQQAAGGSAVQGFFGALLSAIVAGIVAALTKKLTTTARRPRSTGYAKTRRKTTASRSRTATRRKTASVEDVFRDILGNLGK